MKLGVVIDDDPTEKSVVSATHDEIKVHLNETACKSYECDFKVSLVTSLILNYSCGQTFVLSAVISL